MELGGISKEQSALVQVRNVENWIVHHCLNCSTNTHAIHREKGAACVLIAHSLLVRNFWKYTRINISSCWEESDR